MAERFETILVPVDFSDTSRQALEYAIEFARCVSAKLTILHTDYLGEMASADGLGVQRFASLTRITHEEALRQMREFVRRVKFRGVKYETVVQTGRPVLEICGFATQHSVDLIIIATHGRTGFEHLMIGSVAEQVVRGASRSVLVVPSHPEARMAGLSRHTDRRLPQKKNAAMQSIVFPQDSSI
jgi:nucleotide-binding universal stress UspA family protein